MIRLAILTVLATSCASAQGVAPFVMPTPVVSSSIVFIGADSTAYYDEPSPVSLTTTTGPGTSLYTILAYEGYCGGTLDSVIVDGTGGGKMTELVTYNPYTSHRLGMWGIKGLANESHTFSLYAGANIFGAIGVITLSGVDQATPTGSVDTAWGNSSSVSTDIVNDSGDWVVDAAGTWGYLLGYTPAEEQTMVVYKTGVGNSCSFAMSVKSTPGSTNSWTLSGAEIWLSGAVVINRAN